MSFDVNLTKRKIDYLYLINNDDVCLLDIPYECLTEEICQLALEKHCILLKHIPTEFITEEMCQYAVMQQAYNLKFVPNYLRTEELCHQAYSNNKETLQYIPDYIIEDVLSFCHKEKEEEIEL